MCSLLASFSFSESPSFKNEFWGGSGEGYSSFLMACVVHGARLITQLFREDSAISREGRCLARPYVAVALAGECETPPQRAPTLAAFGLRGGCTIDSGHMSGRERATCELHYHSPPHMFWQAGSSSDLSPFYRDHAKKTTPYALNHTQVPGTSYLSSTNCFVCIHMLGSVKQYIYFRSVIYVCIRVVTLRFFLLAEFCSHCCLSAWRGSGSWIWACSQSGR